MYWVCKCGEIKVTPGVHVCKEPYFTMQMEWGDMEDNTRSLVEYVLSLNNGQ